jgi:hypothetical protein
MQIGLGLSITLPRGAAAAGGISEAALPVTDSRLKSRWSAHFSTVTQSGGRMVSATDRQGLADLSEGAAGLGPFTGADSTGRKYWRFEGAEYANIAAGLVWGRTDIAMFAVMRTHRAGGFNRVVSIGSVALGTQSNTGVPFDVSATLVSSVWTAAPKLVTFTKGASTEPEKFIPDAAPQVIGMVSRTVANGGCRIYSNEAVTTATGNTATTNAAGGEIGRYSFNTGASGLWLQADIYELIIYVGVLSNAEADAIQAALVASYSITPKVNRLVLEGDSISYGLVASGTGVRSGDCPAMVLTEPGANRIPSNWHVYQVAHGGDSVTDLVTRRDNAASWSIYKLAGQNVMVFEIGRNDFVTVDENAHYSSVIAYLNTASTGVLQKGWTVRQLSNIASQTAYMTKIGNYRTKIKAAQYLIDTGTNSGGAFDGKLSVIKTDEITYGASGTVFSTDVDSADTTYYRVDATHLVTLGNLLRATGGDDPTKGIAYGLTA